MGGPAPIGTILFHVDVSKLIPALIIFGPMRGSSWSTSSIKQILHFEQIGCPFPGSAQGWMGFEATWFSGKCPSPWQQHGTKLSSRSLPSEKEREFNQVCFGSVGKTQVQLLWWHFFHSTKHRENTGGGGGGGEHLVPADTNQNPRNSGLAPSSGTIGIALSCPKTMCYKPRAGFRNAFAQPDTGQQRD